MDQPNGFVEYLSRRWQEIAAAAMTASPLKIEKEFSRLCEPYAASGRHYHDLAHIAALLELSSTNRALIHDPIKVDLAIYFHDVVYDPARHDNEELSAIWAGQSLQRLGLSPAHVGGASFSASRSTPASDLDYLLDFDLSILASSPAAYDRYAAAIRSEYAIYPDAIYAKGRAKVLRGLLDLGSLYRIPAHIRDWTPPARATLERELSILQST